MKKDIFKVGGKSLKSRLIVGTGKYKSLLETAKAVKASGASMVTVAVRRVNILDKKKPLLSDYIDPKKTIFYQIQLVVLPLRSFTNFEVSSRNGRLEIS